MQEKAYFTQFVGVKKLTPVTALMSSTWGPYSASKCIDGKANDSYQNICNSKNIWRIKKFAKEQKYLSRRVPAPNFHQETTTLKSILLDLNEELLGFEY